LVSNVFFGAQINGYNRSYEWKSYYPFGIGFKDGNNNLGVADINLGITLNILPSLRLLPKLVHRQVGQEFSGNYYGIGAPTFIGNQSIDNRASVGMIGSGIELDITPVITVFDDVLISGPSNVFSNGNYNSNTIILSNIGNSFSTVSGGYRVSANRITAGINFLILPGLRIFGAYEHEQMKVSVGDPTALVFVNGGLDINSSLYQYIAARNDESIRLSGIRAGITYDLNL